MSNIFIKFSKILFRSGFPAIKPSGMIGEHFAIKTYCLVFMGSLKPTTEAYIHAIPLDKEAIPSITMADCLAVLLLKIIILPFWISEPGGGLTGTIARLCRNQNALSTDFSDFPKAAWPTTKTIYHNGTKTQRHGGFLFTGR